MRRSLILIVMSCLALLPSRAQERVAERSYVTTDRSVYVAGDRLWCSVFCVNGEGRLSDISRVAYLELHSAEGVATTAKLALDGGRGGGFIDLPVSLPTGNYRLVAYTAQNVDEVDYDYTGLCSRTLSIFNVFSADRVADGVEVVSQEEYDGRASRNAGRPLPETGGGAGLEWSPEGILRVTNNTGEDISFSLSISREDGILPPANPDIAEFLSAAARVGKRPFGGSGIPELEGEVIQGRILADDATLRAMTGRYAFISVPSESAEVYTSLIGGDGSLLFVTGSFFGSAELICEVEGIDPLARYRFEFTSPFVCAKVAVPERLLLSPSLEGPLKARSLAMQRERRASSDTLNEYLPRREYPLLDGTPISYKLDDYTRFDTLEETFLEFIPQVRTRRSGGRTVIQVRLEETPDIRFFSEGSPLVLLDGVPILDHERLLRYDPRLVQRIDVYPFTHYLGGRFFEGAVNLVTFEHNLPRFPLGNTMKVVAFPGVSLPAARLATQADVADAGPTVFWHPLLRLAPGETLSIRCRLPGSDAVVKASLEGMTATSRPVVGSCVSHF